MKLVILTYMPRVASEIFLMMGVRWDMNSTSNNSNIANFRNPLTARELDHLTLLF